MPIGIGITQGAADSLPEFQVSDPFNKNKKDKVVITFLEELPGDEQEILSLHRALKVLTYGKIKQKTFIRIIFPKRRIRNNNWISHFNPLYFWGNREFFNLIW
jgi:hypothetical protein